MESKSLEQKVLESLASREEVKSSLDFAQELGVDHKELDSVLKSLAAAEYLALKTQELKVVNLTEEGK